MTNILRLIEQHLIDSGFKEVTYSELTSYPQLDGLHQDNLYRLNLGSPSVNNDAEYISIEILPASTHSMHKTIVWRSLDPNKVTCAKFRDLKSDKDSPYVRLDIRDPDFFEKMDLVIHYTFGFKPDNAD